METEKNAWRHKLREMTRDFVDLSVQAHDEAALTWALQRVIVGLLLLGIAPEQIRLRVDTALPPKREGA